MASNIQPFSHFVSQAVKNRKTGGQYFVKLRARTRQHQNLCSNPNRDASKMPTEMEMATLGVKNDNDQPTQINIQRSTSFMSTNSSRKAKRPSMAQQLSKNNHHKCCGGRLAVSKHSVKLLQSILFFTGIIVFGGIIFSVLEEPTEKKRVDDNKVHHKEIVARMMGMLGNNQTLFDELANAHQTLIKAHKIDAFDTEPKYDGNWNISSASMFAFTVVTTIGKLQLFTYFHLIIVLLY